MGKWDGYVPTRILRKRGELPPLKPKRKRSRNAAGIQSRVAGRYDDTRGSGSCWPWLGALDKHGYGIVSGKLRAHRVAWEEHNGRRLVDGEIVMHSCDNPRCCNPHHLRAASHQDNVDDRVAKERSARGSLNGRSKLMASQVIAICESSAPARQIAKQYGLDESTVRGVKSGKTWAWLTTTYSKENADIPKTKGTSQNVP